VLTEDVVDKSLGVGNSAYTSAAARMSSALKAA